MKKICHPLMMLLLFIQTGCQHDEYSDYSTSKGSHSLVATIEGEATAADTRTAVDNSGRVTWIESDELGVFGTQTQNALFKSTGQGSSVMFTGSLDSKGEEAQWAYYPYDKDANYQEGCLKINLPNKYVYTGQSQAPMLGVNKSEDSSFTFYHLGGLLRITLGNGMPTNANRFVISSVGENAPAIAGQAVISNVHSESAVYVINSQEADHSITYQVQGITSSDEFQHFFIPLPVGTYPKIEVSLYLEGETEPTFTRTISNLEVRRAAMTIMPILNWQTGECYILSEQTNLMTEDVVDLVTEIDTNENDEQVTLTYSSRTDTDILPVVGQILLNNQISETFPEGFLGKVVGVTTNSDGSTYVITEPVALDEAFDELYVT